MDFSIKKRLILLFLLVFLIFILATNAQAISPIGSFDTASTTSIYGWACDPDECETSIDVHICFIEPCGSAGAIGPKGTTANLQSEDAVLTRCGCGQNHRFNYVPTQDVLDALAPGTNYVYAYGIDKTGDASSLLGTKTIYKGYLTGSCPGDCPCYNDDFCQYESCYTDPDTGEESCSCQSWSSGDGCADTYTCVNVEGKGRCVAPLKVEIFKPSDTENPIASKTCSFKDGSCPLDFNPSSDCTEVGQYYSVLTSPLGSGEKDCRATGCTSCQGCQKLITNVFECKCANEATQEVVCMPDYPNCAKKTQTCTGGMWVDSTTCPDLCTPGDTTTCTSTQGCVHTLTCGDDCTYPSCPTDECNKDTFGTQPCTYTDDEGGYTCEGITQTCTDTCTLDPPICPQPEAEGGPQCRPGKIQSTTEPCGTGGCGIWPVQKTCQQDCTWPADWTATGDCTLNTAAGYNCWTGTIRHQKCGDCGTQSQRCTNCVWPNSWSSCSCCTNSQGTSPNCEYNADNTCKYGSIANTDYIGDDYCDAGTWTSRTKLIALQLLSLPTSGSDYTLFCGNYDEVLNFLGYGVKLPSPRGADLYAEETNNYCVLNFGGRIAFGTSLNEEIDVSPNLNRVVPFIDVVGNEGDCDGATDDGNYYKCSSNLWYNKKLKSAIYSKYSLGTTASGGTELPQPQSAASTLDTPFSTLITTLETNLDDTQKFSNSQLFDKKIKKFRNLYKSSKGGGSKIVLGAMEDSDIVIKYENFNTNISKIIDNYHERYGYVNPGTGSVFSGIVSLEYTTGTTPDYYVWSYGGVGTFNPADVWPDLTTNLRIE